MQSGVLDVWPPDLRRLVVATCRAVVALPAAFPTMPIDDKVSFLEDQVLRLNAELSRAQGRPADDGAAPAPWLLNAAELPPLLQSYDSRLAELERNETAQSDRADSAEREVREVSAANAKLRAELKHALEATVRGVGAPVRASDSVAVKELKERLDVLYQENEVLTEQQRETGDELERLRDEKLAQARDHMLLVKQLAAMRDELAAADRRAGQAADARDRARSELQACASELLTSQEYTQQAMAIAERHAAERDAALGSLQEHRSMLEAVNGAATSDREALAADLAVAQASERDMRERADELSTALRATTEREQALMDRLSAELSDKAAGAEALGALESRCADSEGRLESAAAELQHARTALNELASERNTLAARAERAERTLATAEAKLSAAAADEKGRRDALASSLRREAMQRTATIEEELRVMETTVADLNHQLQRANRERGAVGGRYDVPTQVLATMGGPMASADANATAGGAAAALGRGGAGVDAAGGAPSSYAAMDEMASRLAAAERERDSIESSQRAVAMQLRAAQEAAANERSTATARAEQVQRQLRRAEDEAGSLRQERAKLLGLNAELEQSLQKARAELSDLQHSSAEEARISKEASSAQINSLQRQLADARALHDQSSSELEDLLKAQEALGSRYRDEAKSIAERSESLVTELRAESERLALRNTELSTQLAATVGRADSLEAAERDQSAQLISLGQQLKESERVRAAQAGKLSQLKAAEAGWEAERRMMMRQARAEAAVSACGSSAASAAAVTAAAGARAAAGSGSSARRAKKKVSDTREAAALEVENALAAARLAQLPAGGGTPGSAARAKE